LLIDAANSKFDLFNNTINFSIDELMMYIVDSYDPKASNQLNCKFFIVLMIFFNVFKIVEIDHYSSFVIHKNA
jgi:hypothetical protein